MEIGKVPNEILEKIVFSNISNKRNEVLVRAAIGEDNGIIDFGDNVCVVSTDPITGTTKDIGRLAIHISCNDVSTSGAEPIAVLLTILCPPETTESELEKIMKDASQAAADVNVEIIGGHTEVTDGVNRVIISTTVIGKQLKSKLPNYEKIKVGDKVVITKYIGIEGTSIIAKELGDKLIDKIGKEQLNKAINLDKMLSVVKDGVIAGRHNAIYMHDITEGGVYGAAWEAAEAIKKGLIIYEDQIPIMDVTKEISDILEIDPYRLISSGSMLIIISENNFDNLKEELERFDIKATVIGEIIEEGTYCIKDGVKSVIDSPGSDELYKALK
ncbi:AIR synthase family protein [Tissierella sp. Yu-01]|uniref:AIR synthase family protein n=1 Tax=Tissierella sp. Yu-01 TaxID=3035694 RepID=UPI00240E9103|nr:AIR synthase family protein [Tissierella sp. Yu-01]WFA08918.1 AIR synthase family protein [Tissierella sp. Yu-01]